MSRATAVFTLVLLELYMANPFLVIGGVIVGIITAGIGILQVPGWVASAQDSAAQNDVAQVTIGQAAMLSTTGKVANNVAGINDEPKAGVSVTVSNGVTVAIVTDDTDGDTTNEGTRYVVAALSQSGKVFARVDGGEIFVFNTETEFANGTPSGDGQTNATWTGALDGLTTPTF